MRLKKINSVAAMLSAIVMSGAVMASSMAALFNSPKSPIINAHGYSIDSSGQGGYTGAEDCDKLFEFNNDYTLQNKWKLYSVYREMGMSKVQALAALGSCACEGGFHSEIIEYAESSGSNDFHYLLPNSDQIDTSRSVPDDEANRLRGELSGLYGIDKVEKIESFKTKYGILTTGNQTGGHKHWELDSWAGKHTEAVYDDYVEHYSQYVIDPDIRTMYTDDTMRGYGLDEGTITALHNPNHGNITFTSNTGLGIAAYFYYPDGVGSTGCGLYGFTGVVLYNLFDYAEERDSEWYDVDTQISFLVSPSGYNYRDISRYIEGTKDCTTIEECMTHGGDGWFYVISGGVDPQNGQDQQRITKAKEIEKELPVNNDRWDSVYAQKILADAGLQPAAERAGINDEGVFQHYAQKIIHYPQNSGFILERDNNDDMKEANTKVFKEYINSMKGQSSSAGQSYSLFELFGEDLHWYRYFGESTYTPTLLDHIWSAVDQDKTDILLNSPIATINYEAYNYLSCNVYPGRPRVLAISDTLNGDYDPRVFTMANGLFIGADYVHGSIQMGISKFCVSIVSFLAGPTIKNLAVDALNKLEESSVWDNFKPIALLILGFAAAAFIVSIVKKGIKYSVGTGSAKEVITRFLVGVLAFGLFGACLANPAGLNNTIVRATNLIDTVFGYALQSQIQNDEVICVTDPDKAVHAVLWKKAIFGCWCRGQFDLRDYDELYTYYAPITSGQSKMPQSHELIDFSDQTGRAYYDSVSNTGDVGVPVGNGKIIKNWAAYLYSCGSKYHIDSTIDKDIAEKVDLTDVYFPHNTLQTTANDPSIEADVFRIVDAQMNISPQYFATGSVVYDYDDSHTLNPWFKLESSLMLFNCALLLFLVPPIFKKLMSFILLMATIVKMIYFAIIELFKEDSGFSEFWETCKKHFFDYVTSSLKLCILVELYYLFVDEGFIKLVLYCILAFVVLGFNLKDARRAVNDTKHAISRIKNRGVI